MPGSPASDLAPSVPGPSVRSNGDPPSGVLYVHRLMERAATDDLLAAAREGLTAQEWDRAFELFQEADASHALAPDDLEAMADAAFWSMRPDDAIDARERAYAGYVGAHENARAAHVALTLARELVQPGPEDPRVRARGAGARLSLRSPVLRGDGHR